MPILDTLIKAYPCENWASAGSSDFSGHGGAITSTRNSSTVILTGVLNNIFDDVSNEQRQDPTISKEYRKIFITNENTDPFPGCTVWLSAIGGGGVDSTLADNDTVKILAGGSLSKMGEIVTVASATGTFVTGNATVSTSASCVGLVVPGEKIFNGSTGVDNSEIAYAGTVLSVNASAITLTAPYGGTSSGAGGAIKLAPISSCYANFVKPLTKSAGIMVGDLAANGGNGGIWICREVTVAGGPGFNDNRFVLEIEMS